jgi:hypothetical protein
VLDDTDTLDRTSRTPIGAEFFGKARDFRRRVQAEDTAFLVEIGALIEPVEARLHRHPDRALHEVEREAPEVRLGTMATLAAIAARRMRQLGLA